MREKSYYCLTFIIATILVLTASAYPLKSAPDTFYWVSGLYDNTFYNKAISVKVLDDYVYMSAKRGTYNFSIIDVSDKTNPICVGHIGGLSDLREGSVSSDGNWFYVSSDDPSATMYVINCTDKTNPTVEGSINLGNDEFLEGSWYVESIDVVFCARYSDNVLVSVNVSDKTNPTQLDTVGTGDRPHGVWANETVACVVTYGGNTLATYNVSNPSSMSLLDTISSGSGSPAHINGDDNPYMYVSNLDGSCNIFDISNPSNIVLKDQISGLGYVCSSIPNDDGTVLYVVRTPGGPNYWLNLDAYNITDKTNATYITSITNTNDSYHWPSATSACADGIWIYVALQGSDPIQGVGVGDGLTIFRFGDEQPHPDLQADFSWIANDGTIVSWLWDFGDSGTSALQNPTYKYSDDGTYTVTLNVTDNDGLTNEISEEVSVRLISHIHQ